MREAMTWAGRLRAGRRVGVSADAFGAVLRDGARRAQVLADLTNDDRLVAACAGSTSLALLEWVAERLDASAHELVLDVGAGLGGTAEWLRRRTGAAVLAVDAADTVVGLRRLFPNVAAVAADAARLPLPSASVDRVLARGPLDGPLDARRLSREAARVLRPQGRLLVVLSDPVDDGVASVGCHTAADHLPLLHEAGFVDVQMDDLRDLPAPPDRWRRVEMAVRATIADRHGTSLPIPLAPRVRAGLVAVRGDQAAPACEHCGD